MKKGDDFFRVTFNRSFEEVQRFEKNISEYTKQSQISRPALIAAICNYFIEAKIELSVIDGRYVVKGINQIPSSLVPDNNFSVVANTESAEELEKFPTISDSDSDEMLRAMGLI